MFFKHKQSGENRHAVEELRATAARLPDWDGVVAIEQFHEFVQSMVDRDVSVTSIPEEWRAVRLGLAQGGVFIKQDTELLLKKDESALYEAPVGLLKEVTDREYRGGSRGLSVPLGGGVRYRVGTMRGQMVAIGKHWETADSGVLTVTDQRIMYYGGRKTLEFPFSKLASLNVYIDAIDLGVTSRQSTSSFRLSDPETMAGMIHAALKRQGSGVTLLRMTFDAANGLA